MLSARGLTPVVHRHRAGAAAGTRDPRCAIDLTGRTDFARLTSLARGARIRDRQRHRADALIAAAGCPSVVLFSRDSDPALCAPAGPAVQRAATARPRRT